ncbi:MAG TPA: hypothetical protein VFP19_01080 [Candidatus Limnocylindrales bacterium]|nr:hypothetical protein [Candidatus Limnocylindrales bacterium]
MTLFDRRALPAVFVGIGMALTIGVSFLLVIPIQPVYWFLAIPAGLLIGWYANSRAGRRRGEWLPTLGNGLVAGVATGVTMAILLLAVRALFFNLDNGYRDAAAGGSFTCQTGADCVYQRYRERPADAQTLADAGITDAASFATYYWNGQLEFAETLALAATLCGLLGGVLYGATRPRAPTPDGLTLPAA